MTPRPPETIAALQTPPGMGGIAVIGLSGPNVEAILAKTYQPRAGKSASQAAGTVTLGAIVDGETLLDEAILARTEAGAELHIHGSVVGVRAILTRLEQAGARIEETARPAFDPTHPSWANPAIGREMLAVLPELAGATALTAFAAQWSGGLSALAKNTLDTLASSQPPAASQAAAEKALRQAAAGLATMDALRVPREVVLAGPPNAGKSTLANAMVGRPVSIVHDVAGTTRDWVRQRAHLHGVAVWLTDTAGLWDTEHHIDAEAVRRARERIEKADLVLLADAANGDDAGDLPDWVHTQRVLHVRTKTDQSAAMPPSPPATINVSAHTGEGLDALSDAILAELHLANIDPTQPRAFTERQTHCLEKAASALDANDTQAAKLALEKLLRP